MSREDSRDPEARSPGGAALQICWRRLEILTHGLIFNSPINLATVTPGAYFGPGVVGF